MATINYNSTITENGFPTAFNVSADVPPYNINTTLNGSGTKFQTQLSFKKIAPHYLVSILLLNIPRIWKILKRLMAT